MPYTHRGKTVYKKEGGKLVRVGTAKGSVQKYLAALYANSDDAKKRKKYGISNLKRKKK